MRTPPAEYLPVSWPAVTILLNSVPARLYPKVEEFAILSAIVANRAALAFNPDTPAFREEEMVMLRLSDATIGSYSHR